MKARSGLMTGHRARLLGASNERAVECCGELRDIAPWVYSLERASPEEDADGIDIVADTRWGKVPIQVKSGYKRARDFRKKRPDIPVVIVLPGDSEAEIRRKVRAAIRRVVVRRGVSFDQNGNPR